MEMTKRILFFMTLAIIILGLSLPALGRGGKETGEGGIFDLDPKAPGITIKGTLAINYEPIRDPRQQCIIPDPAADIDAGPLVNMTFFIRLEGGNTLYAFGGVEASVCYWDFDTQRDAILDVMEDDVIPKLYSEGIINQLNACFAIKDASKILENDPYSNVPGKGEPPAFTLMDFVIAIDRKLSCP